MPLFRFNVENVELLKENLGHDTMNSANSANDSDYQFDTKVTQTDLFPFRRGLIQDNERLIQYCVDSQSPALRFVYCCDGSVKFTMIDDDEKFRKDVLSLMPIEKEGYSSLKAYLELIINGLSNDEKGIPLIDKTLQHSLNNIVNNSKFPYYNEPLRKIQKFMDDHIHSEEDIKNIWTWFSDLGFYITDEDEPDEELRNEYVNNLGIILILAICQRQIVPWGTLQNLKNEKSQDLGVLMDLLIVAISQGRTGKSTIFQNVGLGLYHADTSQIMPKGKHRSPKTVFFQPTLGKLISELCELKITPDNIEELKENLSNRTAYFSKIYESDKEYPLTSVFVATSNNPQFLTGMENFGRFAPIYHRDVRNKVPYDHDEDGLCIDDYFIRLLAEGLYLVTKLGKTWKNYYTAHMKDIQKELAKSVTYRASSFDSLLDYLSNAFKQLIESFNGTIESYDGEPLKLTKKSIKDGFFDQYKSYYEKKDLETSWKQLESDMDKKTGRQQYGYVLRRVHDVESDYNLTHDYIIKLN